MGVIKVPTNFNIELEFEIPEFYKRLISLFIDLLIQYIYLRIANEVYMSIDHSNDPIGAYRLLFLLPIMIYHVVFEITMNGQSIGKKIMGLRVVDENGGRPSISQFAIRWLLRLSDVWIVQVLLYVLYVVVTGDGLGNPEVIFIVVFGFGFLVTDIALVISSKKGQRVGDILAKTILISTRSRGNIEETVFQEVADSYTPSFPQIMQLSDKDLNAIKSILETARRKGDFAMAEAASYKIKNHLKIDSQLGAFDFLDVLLKDYNYLSTK
ncbi:MAG: RDD family protein [Chitinophagaceae bacterium]|nr:RDD family protein [Chitinophagaceae bacterium]